MESKKKGFFAPPMAFQPSVYTVTWLECLGSCHAAQFMPLHAKNGCWVFGNAIRRSGTIVLHRSEFWDVCLSIFGSREGISSQKKMSPWHLWRGTLPAGQFGPEGRWRETRVDYFPMFWDFHRKVTWKFLVKKLFIGIFFCRSTLSITFYMVETLQLFPLCLWTMLQHVKVGHIALSQMVIFTQRVHLIYLAPIYVYTWEV